MKNILMIDQHDLGGVIYFSISDSRRNKNWIIQYDTPLSEVIHYCMGYMDALDGLYDSQIYFTERVQDLRDDQLNYIIRESDFQARRMGAL